MKYGESLFDIAYLVFAIVMGILILRRRKDRAGILMGSAVLVLGCGDAFHLVPRVLNYFIESDFTFFLGMGKLVTSLTMTLFYFLMYYLYLCVYGETENRSLTRAVFVCTALRVLLCLMPQNHWFRNESTVLWGVLRNIPFLALGGIIIRLFYLKREAVPVLRHVWLLVTLSFLFYIPVAFVANLLPILGMLMLPKTVCYMILIWVFRRYAEAPEAL